MESPNSTPVTTTTETSPSVAVTTCTTASLSDATDTQTMTNTSVENSVDSLFGSMWPVTYAGGITSESYCGRTGQFAQTLPTYVNTSAAVYNPQIYMGPNMTSTQVSAFNSVFNPVAPHSANNYATSFPNINNINNPGFVWNPNMQPIIGIEQYPTIYGHTQRNQQNSLYLDTHSTFLPPPATAANNFNRSPINTQPTNNFASEIMLSSSQIASRHVIAKDLPIFSGSPEEWPIFITNFDQSTERCGFSHQENLIRLQKCLKGAALEAVRGKLMMPSTVPLAIETLRLLFGRPDVIHESLQRRLRQLAPVRIDRLETLIHFALAVQNYRATMQAIGLNDYLNDPMLINDLLSKLPGEMKLDWGRRRIAVARVDIVVFDDWLYTLATCASQVTPFSSTLAAAAEEKSNRNLRRERVLVNNAAAPVDVLSTISCVKCRGHHRLQDCHEFLNMNRQNRWKFVKDEKLCIRCFKNHMIRRCNSKKNCGVDNCQMAHNPLLHSQKTTSNDYSNNNLQQPSASNSGLPQNDTTVLCHSKERQNVLFRYVPVTLYANGESINTLAIIDEASSISMIESSLADQLFLDGPSEDLCMRWTKGITQEEADSKYVSLHISSQNNGATKYRLRNVRTVSDMDLPNQYLDISTINDRPHLKNLPIQPYGPSIPRILIGIDNVKLTRSLEVSEDENDELIAARCRIGWSVYGRESCGQSVPERLLHICDCSKNSRFDEMMRNYFSLESVGISPNVKPLLAKEDERALKIMESTTRYNESEKRWETGLLWRYDKIELPNSLPMARKRLECLERKMSKDPDLKKFITSKLNDYIEQGYVRKLHNNEVHVDGKSWYIPIFVVTNVNKNKMRLVWDAAAKVQDTALNSVLLKGPDLLRSLVGVLIRFRERPVALCGDIREMFHQVRIIKNDQVAQKFLWRDCESSREPDVYVMTVMTFGASCSPSLANYVKNKNADRFEDELPQAVAAIKQNTFVDDWLQSVDSEVEMIQLSANVKRIHGEGGFEMRNWISNSPAVLGALNGNSSVKTKCIVDPDSQYQKILGLWWLPENDEFTFIHRFRENIFDESTYQQSVKFYEF